jgi:hypothetical protein
MIASWGMRCARMGVSVSMVLMASSSALHSANAPDVVMLTGWPAAGFVDTEIRCLTELESGNAKKEVQPRIQA